MDQQRIAQRHHAGVESAPGGAQRFLGLEHNRKLDQVEAPHVHERPRALVGSYGLGMGEGVAYLSQRDRAEGRGQIERRRQVACGCCAS